jgi:Outer membrane protein beta-barrel domain
MKNLLRLAVFFALVSLADPTDVKLLGGVDLSFSTKPLGGIEMGSYPMVKPLGGAVLGGGVEFRLGRTFSLEADGLFIQKGSRREDPFSETVGAYPLRANEISFPLLLKVRVRPGGSPYVLAGGELALVLSREPRDIDYGLVFGLGCQVELGRIRFLFEGRYHHGLQDLMTTRSSLRKTRVLAFVAGVSL